MIIKIEKKDFQGYEFSDSYIKWIKKEAKAVKSITANEIIVKSDKKLDCIHALIFLGYAWGQQDNGR